MRLAALVVVLVLVGCGEAGPPPPAAATKERACGPSKVKGKARSGDVDGDGRADQVTLRKDRCRHRLVVDRAAGPTVRVKVKPLSWPGTNPRLIKLAEIDGREGLEPVVSLSPANVYRPGAVYSLRGDSLRRMRRTDARPADLFPLDDEFPADSDCAPEPGTIVVTVGQPADPDTHWDIERTTYRAQGRRFEPIATERFQAEVGTEIGGRPFRSCGR